MQKYKSIQIIDNQKAVFDCLHCGKEASIDVSRFLNRKQYKVSVKCRCGHRYKGVLESRKIPRKKTNLSGLYKIFDHKGREISGSITVENLNLMGLKFKVSSARNTIRHHDLEGAFDIQINLTDHFKTENHQLGVGQKIVIAFCLSDPKKTWITREAIIKWISSDAVGAYFAEKREFDPSLGFFISSLTNV